MSLQADAEAAKLRSMVHGIVTSSTTDTTPGSLVGATPNSFKWAVICRMGGRTDGDIFVSFPYETAWNSRMAGNVQMLLYMSDLRLQALAFMAQNDLWLDKAEIARYQQINTVWMVRARTWLDLHLKYKDDEHKKAHGTLH